MIGPISVHSITYNKKRGVRYISPVSVTNQVSLSGGSKSKQSKHQFSSVQSLSRVRLFATHESQHAKPPCPSPTPRFTQTHVHQVSDAIQPSHPLSSLSSPDPNPSQHQGLFQRVNSLREVAKVLEFQLQHQFFQ